ncbi:P-loop containing protein [Fusarium circinatum]|uniref:P-loop containing protein n=1 Tax=Fusarium circinatum TaxID=48490 RepID=A0A8H5TKY4_FUSCI|nr:P-loop containing protein [Fusarium circinatum]
MYSGDYQIQQDNKEKGNCCKSSSQTADRQIEHVSSDSLEGEESQSPGKTRLSEDAREDLDTSPKLQAQKCESEDMDTAKAHLDYSPSSYSDRSNENTGVSAVSTEALSVVATSNERRMNAPPVHPGNTCSTEPGPRNAAPFNGQNQNTALMRGLGKTPEDYLGQSYSSGMIVKGPQAGQPAPAVTHWYNLSQYWKRLWETLSTENGTLNTKNESLMAEKDYLLLKIRGLESNIEQLNFKHKQELTNRERQYRRWERNLDDKIKRLENDKEAREESIRRAQAAAQTMMEQCKTFASTDSEVEAWFKTNSDSWYDWAKSFSHRDPSSLTKLPSGAWNDPNVFVTLQDGRLPVGLAADQKLPYLLLQGMLTNFVCSHAFGSPWWIFDALHQCDPDLSETRRLLGRHVNDTEAAQKILSSLENIPKDSRHKLRVSLMRFFSTHGMAADAESSLGGREQALLDARTRFARDLSSRFLRGPARHLLRSLSDEEWQDCSSGLEEQINQALQQSLGLWTHRSYMRCYDLPILQQLGCDVFEAGSDLMQPHQAHQLGQPKQSQHHGTPIVMVVQPAIVVCGTEEGEDYGHIRRVWMPAKVFNSNGQNIILVDTPGFNDTYKSDTEILLDLAKWLEVTYRQNAKLTGILYLHRITDVRMDGSAMRNLKMFRKLCGEDPMKNVIILSTFWGQIDNERAIAHEAELKTNPDFWGSMIEHGAQVLRFDGTQQSAIDTLMSLATKAKMTLDIQRELVDEEKPLGETAAGNAVNEELHHLEKKYREKLDEIQQETAAALAEKDVQYEQILKAERQKMEQKLERIHSDQEMLRQERREEIRRIEADNKRKISLLQREYDGKLQRQQLEAHRLRDEDKAEMREQMREARLQSTTMLAQFRGQIQEIQDRSDEQIREMRDENEVLRMEARNNPTQGNLGGKLAQLVASGALAAIDPLAIPVALASLADFVNEF